MLPACSARLIDSSHPLVLLVVLQFQTLQVFAFSQFYGHPATASAILQPMGTPAVSVRACTRHPGRPRGPVFAKALTLLTTLLLSLHSSAQTTEPAPNPSGAPYTLHVYEDLLQMPTLVLNRRHDNYPGLTANQFKLSIDSGPVFHPHHARLEGDDPLQVALVFDLSQPSSIKLLRDLEKTAPARLAGWLGKRDHLSFYAVDCHLVRSTSDQPYNVALLQAAAEAALTAPALHRRDNEPKCGDERRLWDSLGAVIHQIHDLPGWRVVLLVSDGRDGASSNTWDELASYAGRFDVTLMGMRPAFGIFDSTAPIAVSPSDHRTDPSGQEDLFALLCNKSGGIVLPFRTDTLVPELNRAVALLRDRYIVEFPRPRDAVVGLHHITTAVPDAKAVVLSSGLSFPPHNGARDTEPGTVAPDPTRLPQVGNRRILAAPQ